MELSIIIPAYNVEKYIGRTINSLSAQTNREFEIIIVDDGSTDNTIKAVEDIINEKGLNNCKVIKKRNGGVSSARNKGICEASGKYVMFLDGDDYVSDNLVQNIYGNINEKQSDIICWGYNIVDENCMTIQNYNDLYNFKHEEINGIEALNRIVCYGNMKIWTGSIAYRKEFLNKYHLYYTEGCTNGEDQEFIFKTLSRANQVNFLDKILSYYVKREVSISNSYNIKRFDSISAMKRTYYYIESLANNEFELINEQFKNDYIVHNYIYNYVSCFSNLDKICKSKRVRLKKLFNDIEMGYPNLNKEIFAIMKNYHGKNLMVFFKCKTFMISPLLYIWIFEFENKLIKFKKLLKN